VPIMTSLQVQFLCSFCILEASIRTSEFEVTQK
jgi:hypothetical protein